MGSSPDVDVPFPAAALAGKTLGDIRLEMTYLPTPYREEAVAVRVSLAKSRTPARAAARFFGGAAHLARFGERALEGRLHYPHELLDALAAALESLRDSGLGVGQSV